LAQRHAAALGYDAELDMGVLRDRNLHERFAATPGIWIAGREWRLRLCGCLFVAPLALGFRQALSPLLCDPFGQAILVGQTLPLDIKVG
jgi:hypothetical protein